MNIAVFNMAFYPPKGDPIIMMSIKPYLRRDQRGWNPETSGFQVGGIMRKIDATDFEATNVEYIEFWMMDPFAYDKSQRW